MPRRKKQTQNVATAEMDEDVHSATIELEPTFATIHADLIEINKKPNVNGYILRNSTSAAIDLKNPEKLQGFAILSAEATKTAEEISKIFNLDRVESILLEGKDQKILSILIGENKISVFMEKDANHSAIAKQFSQY